MPAKSMGIGAGRRTPGTAHQQGEDCQETEGQASARGLRSARFFIRPSVSCIVFFVPGMHPASGSPPSGLCLASVLRPWLLGRGLSHFACWTQPVNRLA
jgi:hypothetical protein